MLIGKYEIINLYPCILNIIRYNLSIKYSFPKSIEPLYYKDNCEALDKDFTIFYNQISLNDFNYIPEKKENTLYIVNQPACYNLLKLGYDYFIYPERQHKVENGQLYYFNLFKP